MARISPPRRSISRPARARPTPRSRCRWKCATRPSALAIANAGFGRRGAPARHLVASGARWGWSPPATPKSEQPLLSGLYYLERALAPYADLTQGHDRRAAGARCLGADAGRHRQDRRRRSRRASTKFVGDGGVLVRFAGARMTQGADDLVPVKLRTGGRYLGGALAWAEPQHLAPFPEASPFRGLDDSRRRDRVAPGAGRAHRRAEPSTPGRG